MAALHGGPINTTETTRSMPEGTPLPPGIYTGIVTKTAQKETNDRTGVFIEVEFDITSPPEFANNRKFWDRFNIVNASQEAARIGKECLADLGLAAGYEVLEDDEQLQGQEVIMELIIEPAKPYVDKKTGQQRDGKAQNKCRKYWPIGTDVEAAHAARKAAAKGAAAPAAAPAAARPAAVARPAAAPAQAPAARWNQAKPAAAAPVAAAQPAAAAPAPARAPVATQPQVQQAAAPAAASPDTNKAPWKRNK